MASKTKSVAGNTTTVVVTDHTGATMTVAATANPGYLMTATISTTGILKPDGMAMMADQLRMLSTGLIPL
jgi:hypothetical protein